MKQSLLKTIVPLLILALMAGCDGGLSKAPTRQPTMATTLTPVAVSTGESTQVSVRTLRIWLPPQFDPAAGTPSGDLLQARLDEFVKRRPGLTIEVRIKAPDGVAGLLDSLIVTSNAAPGAAPDLIALSRADLEAAALKGVLHPLDGLSTLMDVPDWYSYARQLARVQKTTFGLPFAGDALVLLYRPASLNEKPATWDAIHEQTGVLAFPAADPRSLFGMCLYLSTGGTLVDDQGHPAFDLQALTDLLTFFHQGEQSGWFPNFVAQYQTDLQAWQAYRDQRSNMVVTWASRYLSEGPGDSTLTPLPGLDGTPFTLADGWVWALAGSQPDQQAMAVELAEFLVNSDFLGTWTAAAGYLPPRPNALATWPETEYELVLNDVILTAQLIPPADVLLALGPVLQAAISEVIKGQKSPEDAAQAVMESLK